MEFRSKLDLSCEQCLLKLLEKWTIRSLFCCAGPGTLRM
jgi:hypothetical protein